TESAILFICILSLHLHLQATAAVFNAAAAESSTPPPSFRRCRRRASSPPSAAIEEEVNIKNFIVLLEFNSDLQTHLRIQRI
ncbi:hypothetical protein LINPERHAP2_LOCUS42281, partial [Linum perenne]